MESRRKFLKTAALASGIFMTPRIFNAMDLMSPDEISGYKQVVFIQLAGGNDGLNTIIPYQNDLYHSLRPNIALTGSGILKLNDEIGINSQMKELKNLYDNGELAVIGGVGYDQPNRSHFRSSDIWQTASDSNSYRTTGWLGRYLDLHGKQALQVLEVDDTLSLALKGERLAGMAVKNPDVLYRTIQEPLFKELVEKANQAQFENPELDFLYKTVESTYSSANKIHEAAHHHSSETPFPGGAFGKKMKQITELITAGFKTKVYYVSLGGFDTHANQLGKQNRLLKSYSESVGAMVDELKRNNRFKDTLIVTFSEFGRRVKQNGSNGTDHGTANNVLAIGGSLKKSGIIKAIPSLSDLDKNGDLKFNTDFRSIYSTILDNWLEADSISILGRKFDYLGFV